MEQEIVEEVIDEGKDEERALLAGRKKALSLIHIPDIDYPTFRTRLGSFLQRRGFGYGVSKRVVQALWRS